VDLNVLDSEDGEYRRSEQSRGLHLNLLESGDVLWSDKEGVGGQSRVEEWIYFTIEQRCVTIGQGGSEWSEQSGGVPLNLLESRDVLQLDNEDMGGWSRVEECT
jgi:hypothetical protein